MAEWLAEIFPSLGQSLQDRHHSADLMSPLQIHFEITSYYKRRGKTLSSVTQRFSSPCRQGLLYPSLTSGLVVEKLY